MDDSQPHSLYIYIYIHNTEHTSARITKRVKTAVVTWHAYTSNSYGANTSRKEQFLLTHTHSKTADIHIPLLSQLDSLYEFLLTWSLSRNRWYIYKSPRHTYTFICKHVYPPCLSITNSARYWHIYPPLFSNYFLPVPPIALLIFLHTNTSLKHILAI